MGSEPAVASKIEGSQARATSRKSQQGRYIERFKFTGSGGEYFGIWIVNILLTILTLGIYSAWAKVRNHQYFYSNTYLKNSSFEYTATPWQILRGRLIAVVLFVFYIFAETFIPLLGLILAVLLLLASPWLIMKSLAFNAYHSEYRSIRFQFHQNLFDSFKTVLFIPLLAMLPAALLFAVFGYLTLSNGGPSANPTVLTALPILAILSIYLAYPFLAYITSHYVIGNHAYGGADFRFRLRSSKPFLGVYIKALLLALLAFIAVGAVVVAIATSVVGLDQLMAGNLEGLENAMPMLVVAYLFIIGIYTFIIAYVKAKTYNLIYQNTAIENHTLRAKVKTADLTILFITNTLGIALTAGLFIPWAKVRTAKFFTNNTALQVHGNLNRFIAVQNLYQNAVGEEIGDMFDIDVGI